MIVGVDAEARYDSARARIPRGSGLTSFSDGVYEFRAKNGTIFGIERFTTTLVEVALSPPRRSAGPRPRSRQNQGRIFLEAIPRRCLPLGAAF